MNHNEKIIFLINFIIAFGLTNAQNNCNQLPCENGTNTNPKTQYTSPQTSDFRQNTFDWRESAFQ